MLPSLYGLRLIDDLRWGPTRPQRVSGALHGVGGERSLSFAPALPTAAAGGAQAPLAPRAVLPSARSAGHSSSAREGLGEAVRKLLPMCFLESDVAGGRDRCGLHCYSPSTLDLLLAGTAGRGVQWVADGAQLQGQQGSAAAQLFREWDVPAPFRLSWRAVWGWFGQQGEAPAAAAGGADQPPATLVFSGQLLQVVPMAGTPSVRVILLPASMAGGRGYAPDPAATSRGHVCDVMGSWNVVMILSSITALRSGRAPPGLHVVDVAQVSLGQVPEEDEDIARAGWRRSQGGLMEVRTVLRAGGGAGG